MGLAEEKISGYYYYESRETRKTVNIRNIYGMLLCCEKLANKARDNQTANNNDN